MKYDGGATGHVLAVVGGKGGVGTTTVALGLAGALARAGRDPVVADADHMVPDVGRYAAVEGGGLGAYADGAPLSAVARRAPDLPAPARVLPAAPGLDGAEVQQALARLQSASQTALVDCPSGVGRAAARPLPVADRALLVTAPTEAAVRGAATASRMAGALGADPTGAAVVGCRDTPSLESLLGCPVVGAVPTVDRPLRGPDASRAYDRISTEIPDRTFIPVDNSL